MDTRRLKGALPEAIVVVNGFGVAVDCNNAFAQLHHTPAGMLVGEALTSFSPELATNLDRAVTSGDEIRFAIGHESFVLDVQPFTAGQATGDRIVRLRPGSVRAVA